MAEEVLHAQIRAETTGEDAVNRLRMDTGRLHAEIQKLNAEERHTTAMLGRFAEGLAFVGERSEGLRDHAWELRAAVGESGATFGELIPMLGALGAATSVVGLVDMARETAEARTQLAAMAETLGMTVPQLQGLQLAARETDVPVETMQRGLLLLDRSMASAASGKNKDVAEIFNRMGISLKDAQGHLRSANDVLPLIAESLSRTEDSTLRNAVAMRLFGRSGADLIPLLKEGKRGIDELFHTSSRLNAVYSQDDTENVEAFKNSWIELDTALSGLKDTITADLAPVLTPLLNGLTDWVASHRGEIGTTIRDDFIAIRDAARKVDWKTIIGDIEAFGRGLNEGVQFLGGWKSLGETLATIAALKFAWSATTPVREMGKIGLEAVALARTLTRELGGAWGAVERKAGEAAGAEEAATLMPGGKGGPHAPAAVPKAKLPAATGRLVTEAERGAEDLAETVIGGTILRGSVPALVARFGTLGVGLAAAPAVAAGATLAATEYYLPPVLRAAVHADGSTDISHPDAHRYTPQPHDPRHAVTHAYGRHDQPRSTPHGGDPFEWIGDVFSWLNGLRDRSYAPRERPPDLQEGKVAVTVQLEGLPAGATVNTTQSGIAHVERVDVGQNHPMGYPTR